MDNPSNERTVKEIVWTRRLWSLGGIGVTSAFAGVLALAVMDLSRVPAGLTAIVARQMDQSGVDYPVTAVLLNFRGYDTWLETGVLLFALLGVLALRRSYALSQGAARSSASPVLLWSVRVLTPAMFVAGGYLLWNGTHAPGGAFQAGAVFGATLVLLRFGGYEWMPSLGWRLRMAVALGFASFLSVGVWTKAQDIHLLEYPQPWTGALIIAIEVGVALATAVTLAALFAGSDPSKPEQSRTGARADHEPGGIRA